jgi:hypothetical protein
MGFKSSHPTSRIAPAAQAGRQQDNLQRAERRQPAGGAAHSITHVTKPNLQMATHRCPQRHGRRLWRAAGPGPPGGRSAADKKREGCEQATVRHSWRQLLRRHGSAAARRSALPRLTASCPCRMLHGCRLRLGVRHLHDRHRLGGWEPICQYRQLREPRLRFQLLLLHRELLPDQPSCCWLWPAVLRAAGPCRGNPLFRGPWYTLEGRLISARQRGWRFMQHEPRRRHVSGRLQGPPQKNVCHSCQPCLFVWASTVCYFLKDE